MSEGPVDSQIGPTTYEFTEDRFIRRSSSRYEEMDWSVIIKIVQTRNHIYLYDSSISAFIIPKGDLGNEEIKTIVAYAVDRIGKVEL